MTLFQLQHTCLCGRRAIVAALACALLATACRSGEPAPRAERGDDESAAAGLVTERVPAFGVTLGRPSSWEVVTTSAGSRLQAVNALPAARRDQLELPLTIHAPAGMSHVSLYPLGWGTELPSGARRPLSEAAVDVELPFEIRASQSWIFLLENGEPWAWLLRPAEAPPSWSRHGFVFGQVAVDDFEARCFGGESGEPKPQERCDPLMGDRVERSGEVREGEGQRVRAVLASLELAASTSGSSRGGDAEEGAQEHGRGAEQIELAQPGAQAEVASPLEVRGEAPGTWFFEGSFPIALRVEGERIATARAEAEGPWMHGGPVPFSGRLEFEVEQARGAQLVLARANPSGLPQNAAEHVLPLLLVPDSPGSASVR